LKAYLNNSIIKKKGQVHFSLLRVARNFYLNCLKKRKLKKKLF